MTRSIGTAYLLPLSAIAGALLAVAVTYLTFWGASPPTLREMLLLAITGWTGVASLVVLRSRPNPVELADLRSDLLAAMCHELRTPLTAIRGYTEMLLEDAPDAAVRGDLLRILKAEASLTRLVSDVLDLQVRDARIRCEPVSVHDVVRESIGRCRREGLDRRIELELHGETTQFTDRERLIRILTSLLATAFHADAQGPIRLVVRSQPQRIEVDLHDGVEGPTTTELAASAMPPQIPRSGHRSGLPLSIAASNLRAMGGELRVGQSTTDAPLGFQLPTCSPFTWSPTPTVRVAGPPTH